MELIDTSKEVFISASVHKIIGGKEEKSLVTGFKVPKEGISDIQEFLRESYIEQRIRPLLKNCVESIHESVLESAQNAFFTDICYHVVTVNKYHIDNNEKDIPYVK